MYDTFAATGIARTNTAGAATLELELVGTDGRLQKIRVTADIAAALARTLQEFADRTSTSSGATLTKTPAEFSVGAGRFEDVVLVRFEDDVPYALPVAEAMELGEALIEQAENVSARPAKVFQ